MLILQLAPPRRGPSSFPASRSESILVSLEQSQTDHSGSYRGYSSPFKVDRNDLDKKCGIPTDVSDSDFTETAAVNFIVASPLPSGKLFVVGAVEVSNGIRMAARTASLIASIETVSV